MSTLNDFVNKPTKLRKVIGSYIEILNTTGLVSVELTCLTLDGERKRNYNIVHPSNYTRFSIPPFKIEEVSNLLNTLTADNTETVFSAGGAYSAWCKDDSYVYLKDHKTGKHDVLVMPGGKLTNEPLSEKLKHIQAVFRRLVEHGEAWIKKGILPPPSPDVTYLGNDTVFLIMPEQPVVQHPFFVRVRSDAQLNLVRFTTHGQDLLITSKIDGEAKTLKDVIQRISNVLRHMLTYTQKDHRHMFYRDDEMVVNQTALNMMGYGSLVSHGTAQTVTLNFDQVKTFTKVQWLHTEAYTKAISQAVDNVLDLL